MVNIFGFLSFKTYLFSKLDGLNYMKNYISFILCLFLFSACISEDYDDVELNSIAICKDGIAIDNISGISYKCKNYDLIGLVSLETMDATRANDSWGWTDPVTGKEFALIGLDNGTGVVDISDPINPVYLENFQHKLFLLFGEI